MRIDPKHAIYTKYNVLEKNNSDSELKVEKSSVSEITNDRGQPTKEAFQVAVNRLNEFMEYTNKSSKFIFHEGLGKYYVEVVDAKTEEVIKEIPPKELLDAYYEMQKMIGNIVDQTI